MRGGGAPLPTQTPTTPTGGGNGGGDGNGGGGQAGPTPVTQPTAEPEEDVAEPATDTNGGMCGAREALAKRICEARKGNNTPGGAIASYTDSGVVTYNPLGLVFGTNNIGGGLSHAENINVDQLMKYLPGKVPVSFAGGITVDVMTGRGPCPEWCQGRIASGEWLEQLAGVMPSGLTSLTLNWWVVADDGTYSLYWQQMYQWY